MMADLNQCQFIGRLGADPEIKSFANGGRIANLRIAVGEKWKDKATGEQKERTEWHNVAIFSEGLAGVAERYLRKGSKVYLEGQLRTRKWQDNNGNDRYTTEIIAREMKMLSPRASGGGSGELSGGQGFGSGDSFQEPPPMGDDVPF